MDPFHFHVDIKPRFVDLDVYGHVNNAVYLTYLEEARVAYCNRVDVFLPDRGDIGFVVSAVSLKYKAPLCLDETIRVKIRAENFKSRSFEFVYRLQSLERKRVAAFGRTEHFCWDIAAGRPVHFPPEFLSRMKEFEGLG